MTGPFWASMSRFVVAMSARNAKSLDDYRGAFQSLLNSFVPMRVTVSRARE